MEPGLKSGDKVLLFTWAYLFSKPRKGDVIAFKANSKVFIKRISKVQGNAISVQGDNRHDSLKLKPIKESQIIGKIIMRY